MVVWVDVAADISRNNHITPKRISLFFFMCVYAFSYSWSCHWDVVSRRLRTSRIRDGSHAWSRTSSSHTSSVCAKERVMSYTSWDWTTVLTCGTPKEWSWLTSLLRRQKICGCTTFSISECAPAALGSRLCIFVFVYAHNLYLTIIVLSTTSFLPVLSQVGLKSPSSENK